MAKRMQEQSEENRIVAKSMPIVMNLTSSSHLSRQGLRLCKIRLPRKARGYSRHAVKKDWTSTGRPGARDFNQDAASSSQELQKDAVLDVSTRRLVATEEDQEHLNFPDDSISTRRLVASGNSETEGQDKFWPHNLHTPKDGAPHMEKVFSIVM